MNNKIQYWFGFAFTLVGSFILSGIIGPLGAIAVGAMILGSILQFHNRNKE